MATTPEGKIKGKLNRKLQPFIDAGQIYKLMPVQTGMGAVGLDYHLCVAGHAVMIETKAKAGLGLTARQLDTQARIERAGGTVLICYDDVSIAYVMEVIQVLIAHKALKDRFAA